MPSRLMSRMYPFDWMVIIFCTAMCSVIILFGRPASDFLPEFGFYSGVIVLVLLIVRYVDEKRSRIHSFIRLLYPLPIVLGLIHY